MLLLSLCCQCEAVAKLVTTPIHEHERIRYEILRPRFHWRGWMGHITGSRRGCSVSLNVHLYAFVQIVRQWTQSCLLMYCSCRYGEQIVDVTS